MKFRRRILKYRILRKLILRYHPLSWSWPIAQSNNVRLHRNERSESMRTGNNNISCEMCFMQRWIHAGMMVSLYNSKGFGEELRLIGFDSCFIYERSPNIGSDDLRKPRWELFAPLKPCDSEQKHFSNHSDAVISRFPGFLRSSWHRWNLW